MLLAIALLFASGLGAFVARGDRDEGVSVGADVAGKTTTVRIPVQGMTCVVCAAGVKKALESVDGVQHAEVDLAGRQALVRYDEGKVSPERLMAAINQLGYVAGPPVSEVPQ